ncbi:unnamed protein product [Nezara viridula]|uniref:Uncharacterized protein n=1 Tax=Nezara viridula TaxID=85310 RepID=A0A9P0HC58_NEZVI|nr:unnamed protein product [Nezara viridula]
MRFKDEIIEKIRNHQASKDIDRVLNSKSNPRYRKICSFNVTRPEDYLQFRALNLNKLRAVSRLRIASLRWCCLGGPTDRAELQRQTIAAHLRKLYWLQILAASLYKCLPPAAEPASLPTVANSLRGGERRRRGRIQ